MSGQLHAPAALPPSKNFGTNWIEGWEGPRVLPGVCREEKISYTCQNSNPFRSAFICPLQRLRCPGSSLKTLSVRLLPFTVYSNLPLLTNVFISQRSIAFSIDWVCILCEGFFPGTSHNSRLISCKMEGFLLEAHKCTTIITYFCY